jgi:hypothetical protein
MGEWRYRSTFSRPGTRWRWVVSFTPLPLYPSHPLTPYPLDGRFGLNDKEKLKLLTLLGLELGLLGRPPRSQLLYRLRYWGFCEKHCEDWKLLRIYFAITCVLFVGWVRERTVSTEQPPLVNEVSVNFCGQRVPRGRCYGFPYCRILGFLDRSRYFFFQVAPQLYSRGWVDPVSDPLLLTKCGSAGIELGPVDL